MIAAQCKDPFGRLIAVGIVSLLFAQMAINCGMTIGVMPITGMTLPFVSYGGSSLITAWLMLGLLVNIAMRRPQYLARESFDFSEQALDQLGVRLLRLEMVDQALGFLELNRSLHEDSWNAHDRLGDAHAAHGDRASALECYRAASRRSPQRQQLLDKIKKMEVEDTPLRGDPHRTDTS